MPYGQLSVTVVEAKNLKDTDFFDKADPYIILSVDRQNKKRTKTKQDAGKNAAWNETFTFEIIEGQKDMLLEVFDEDIGTDDLMGGTIVDLRPVFASGLVDQWFALKRKSGKAAGDVRVVMRFTSQGPTSGHTHPAQTPGGAYPQQPHLQQPHLQQPYAGYGVPPQNPIYHGLGPQGGAMPSSYGSGTPPPITPPSHIAYPSSTGGFPDPSAYGAPSHDKQYSTPPVPQYGAPAVPQYGGAPTPQYGQHETKHETKPSGPAWASTAGIAAGAAALGFIGGKLKQPKNAAELELALEEEWSLNISQFN
ncbi:2129_t:CDS:2 [Ambispora gerdemannii]|uniref:2129_t:CDS:1 n=1 Tax=Ambispora gerdemannii TaxID=144530 RepID=A0A9N9DF02_9GLOM|nr:2129_t:CDS:2 [Ambispora gerdemannii]